MSNQSIFLPKRSINLFTIVMIIFLGLLLTTLDGLSYANGDLNCNGTAAEVEDYLLYVAYFYYGPGVFTIDPECQIAQSDVNSDGDVLTVADLVCLYLFMVDGEPPGGSPQNDTAVFIDDFDYRTVTLQYPDTLFMALMNFADDVTIPLLAAGLDHMPTSDSSPGVIIYPYQFDQVAGITAGTLLTYHSAGQLSGTMVYDFSGAIVPSRVVNVSNGACGDANMDLAINVSDAVYIINYVFASGPQPLPYNAGDCNCDGVCNVSDAVWIVNYVFAGGNGPCDLDGDGLRDC